MHTSKAKVCRMWYGVMCIFHLKRGIDFPEKARSGRIPNADQLNIKSILANLRVEATLRPAEHKAYPCIVGSPKARSHS